MIEDDRVLSCENVYNVITSLYLYEELEYIESTGTQYVDTDYIPNSESRIVLDIESDDPLAESHILGSRNSMNAETGHFSLFIVASLKWRSDYYNSKLEFSSSAPRVGQIHIDKNKNITTIGSYSVTSTYTTFYGTYPMYLFTVNTGGSPGTFTKVKLFNCQIYDGDDLVRDFIPARSPLGEVGLYDRVYDKFYGNNGTGDFLPGSMIGYINFDKQSPEFKTKLARVDFVTNLLKMKIPNDDIRNRPISAFNLKTILDKAMRKGMPDGYYPVEYIEGTGTQYIDTGYVPGGDTRVKTRLTVSEKHNDSMTLFGSRQTNAGSKVFAVWGSTTNGGILRWDYNKTHNNLDASYINTWEIDFNKNNFKANSIQSSLSKATYTVSGKSLYIFALNQGTFNSDQIARMKLYYMKIYDNGNLVRDLIPAVRMSDNVSGVYDKITENFYTNIGSGNFVVGPRIHILPNKPYTQLSYVEGTGTQLLDTNIYTNANTRIIAKVSPIKIGDNPGGFFFGSCGTTTYNDGYELYAYQGSTSGTNLFVMHNTVYKHSADYKIKAGDIIECDFNKSSFTSKLNGSNYFSCTFSNSMPASKKTLKLFGLTRTETTFRGAVRFYYCKIYDNDILLRNFIPAKSNDGEIGMYDLVTKTFYGNVKTGSFISGPEL